MTLPLFRRVPSLLESVAHIPLADLPTPVERLEGVGSGWAAAGLWVKRDDLCHEVFGGSKLRKLELLLASALVGHYPGVLTYGAAGSTHVTATAFHAAAVGLPVVAILLPAPADAPHVAPNLLLAHACGAELRPYPRGSSLRRDAPATREESARFARRHGAPPYVVPIGGTSARGNLGFVNAAFELLEQVEAGLLPLPDRVYLPLASMGSAVGLAIGFALAEAPVEVFAVQVVEDHFIGAEGIERQRRGTIELLHRADPSLPPPASDTGRLSLRCDQLGEGYGRLTPAAETAIQHAASADLSLDRWYTAKAFAALAADGEAGLLAGRHALLWHTWSRASFSQRIAGVDPHELPRALHRYFDHSDHAASGSRSGPERRST